MSTAFSFVCLSSMLLGARTLQEPEPAPAPAEVAQDRRPGAVAPPLSTTDRMLEERYFEICDHDGNGWISMGEAKISLEFDQKDFAVIDTDSDGRVTSEEFADRFRSLLERGVGFRPPVEVREESLVPRRNAEQLRNAYDQNGDLGIGEVELAQLLSDYDRRELPLEIVLDKLDRDESSRIDGDELHLLARLLSATTPLDEESAEEPSPGPEVAEKPRSVDELFGVTETRDEGLHTAPRPPGIRGPVQHFRRLDLDNDGKIELDDLERLQRPLHLSVRPSMVLAALDGDEDGTLSRAELMSALGAGR